MAPPEEIVAEIARYFTAFDAAVAVYLFGSHAAGKSGPSSDVDVAVLGLATADRAANLELRARCIAELQQALRAPVDVVLLEDADHILADEVLRHGSLVLETDRDAHVLWKASRITRILDFQPTLIRLEQGVSASLRRPHGTHGHPV
jgi:predicted nucleotidyltransferase